MSVSATKFSASRSSRHMPGKRAVGWGALGIMVIGFTWWAMTGRGGLTASSVPAVSAEDAAKMMAADATQPAPGGEGLIGAGGQAVPTGTPVVTNAPTMKSGSEPASLTMGASPAPRESSTRLTVEKILASNTPGSTGTPTLTGAPQGAPAEQPAPGGGGAPGGDPGTAPGTPPSTSGGSLSASSAVGFLVNQGDSLIAQGKPVEARDAYNRALFDARSTESDRIVLRDKLAALAEAITWSPRVETGDAMSMTYAFQSGDRLVKLPHTKDLAVDWRLIARVNRIADPGRIGLNQRMKLIKGPFHAVVHKGAFRMDVFSNVTDSAGNRIFVKSFAVGLGEHGSTPTGSFIVKPRSKLVNPKWVNPRTGEKFGADDPKNPIGERWIGLDGTDATTKLLSGYGIHGTIEPESIGQEKSMGCVRLVDRDVEFIYELLFEGRSTVEIRP